MKARQISATEVLPVGTEVFVDDFKGFVLTGELVPSSNNAGLIALHHVVYTHYFSGLSLQYEKLPLEQVEIAPCNYSFIFVKELNKSAHTLVVLYSNSLKEFASVLQSTVEPNWILKSKHFELPRISAIPGLKVIHQKLSEEDFKKVCEGICAGLHSKGYVWDQYQKTFQREGLLAI